MNPLDEIEMEMGGKLRVGQKVRTYYTQKVGVIVGKCPHHGENWHVEVDDAPCEIRCAAECNLTPLPEPERVNCHRQEGPCGVGQCGDWCWHWRTLPSPGLLQRLSLITYPELFICEKAGECKGKDGCFAGKLHDRTRFCERGDWCSTAHAHRRCIPYVPEDEAREWRKAKIRHTRIGGDTWDEPVEIQIEAAPCE